MKKLAGNSPDSSPTLRQGSWVPKKIAITSWKLPWTWETSSARNRKMNQKYKWSRSLVQKTSLEKHGCHRKNKPRQLRLPATFVPGDHFNQVTGTAWLLTAEDSDAPAKSWKIPHRGLGGWCSWQSSHCIVMKNRVQIPRALWLADLASSVGSKFSERRCL